MGQWIEIPEDLLAEACDQISPPHPRRDFTAVNQSLVEAMIEYLEEGADGCDHSVGICQCALAALLHELRLVLNGEQTCRMCAGDTYLYSPEKHAAERSTLEARYGVGAFDYDTESLGYMDCPACNKTGATRLY